MNFYSVPAISYQQQQKLKRKSKKSTQRSSRKSSSSDHQDRSSLYSSAKSEHSVQDEDSSLSDDKKTRQHSYLHNKTTTSSNSSINSPSFARISNSKISDSSQNSLPRNHENESPRVSDDYRRPSISSSMASFVSGKFSRGAKLHLSQSSTPYALSVHSLEAQDTKSDFVAGNKEEHDSGPHEDIPDFVPILDLSVLNNIEEIKKEFFNPSSLKQRYETFLSILGEHHINDPINFASVREQSLRSFARRLKQSKNYSMDRPGVVRNGDTDFHEDSLTYELLKIRCLLREQIKNEAVKKKQNPSVGMVEEILHCNFYNYIRYLVNLPDIPPRVMANLNEIQSKHYHYRSYFYDMSAIIYAQKKEGFEDEVSTIKSRVQLLVQAILTASYEFILLEKYVIQILVKLNNDFLIESRITKSLFDSYKLNISTGDKESIKVLVLNSCFSVNYSWYLAITTPFVRIFETNIFNEKTSSSSDEADSCRRQLAEKLDSSDKFLFENYFNCLKLTDFNSFSSMSRKKLVKLQENFTSNDGVSSTKSRVTNFWRPSNFEFCTIPLRNMPSGIFHCIHIRDFQSQFNSENYKKILCELRRVLKHGGYLEIPLFLSGKESLKNSWDVFGDRFVGDCAALDDGRDKHTPTSLKDLLSELSCVFGEGSIKFTTLLMTVQNEMNRFLLHKAKFRAFEVEGNVEEYSESLSEGNYLENNNLNYYIYIQAKNCISNQNVD